MDKRQLHHFWTRIRAIKPWYFLIITVLSAVVCVYGLRANNEHMLKLRDAVYAADKNNGDVQGSLAKLQAYVTAHMNTDLSGGPNAVYPPIQLKYTYDRLVQAESDKLAQQNSQNSQVYTDAQHYCEAKIPTGFSGSYRISCIQSYIASHGITNPVSIAPIPDGLYKFDFLSPVWSPDLAGWSFVAAALSALLFVIFFVSDKWLKARAT